MKKAKVADIFYSLQGEGIYAGKHQVFVRFYGCRQACNFCDTPLSAYDKYTPIELYHRLKEFTQDYHSVCLTGGEPLLQVDFLKEFLRLLKYDGIRTYLETNGILVDELNDLIDDIDIVAMDFKLPSSAKMPDYWPEHRKFLKTALSKEVFVKMVICSSTEVSDLDKAIDIIIKARAKKIPVILQPNFFELGKELLAKTRSFQKHSLKRLKNVQVIPQLHKITGVR